MLRSTRVFEIEVGGAAISVVLLVVTVLWRDWIEIVFRFDPDNDSGLAEWSIVGVLVVCTLTFSTLAGMRWRAARVPT